MKFTLFNHLSNITARITEIIIVVMTVICMTSLVYQVFTRYVLGKSAIWTEELALFLFTWIVMLAGTLGVRGGFHVRLTILLDLLPYILRVWADRLIGLLVVVFGVFLAISGYDYFVRTLGQVSAAVRYPIEALHLAAPVTGVLIVLHGLAQLIGTELPNKTTPETGE